MRERLPGPIFIVVLLIVLMLAGFACACLTDHPQALDRALLAAAAPPEPLVQAALAAVATLLSASLLLVHTPARAGLQNFRF